MHWTTLKGGNGTSYGTCFRDTFASMAGEKSPHILNTSSTLLGFCLVVMTSLKIADKHEATLLDEATALSAVLLMASCILSFLSIRTTHHVRSERLERSADVVFLGGLFLVFITILLIAFHFIA